MPVIVFSCSSQAALIDNFTWANVGNSTQQILQYLLFLIAF